MRAVESGSLSRFGNIDPTDAGRTSRYSAAFDWLRSSGNGSTRLTAYTLQGGLNLFQNFTYFLENPADGDQVEQEGRRWVSGTKLVHRRLGSAFGRAAEHAVGASLRNDAVSTVGLYNTVRRQRSNAIRDDGVDQTSIGLFGQTEIEWSRIFRTTLGVRGDFYRYAVDALRAPNTGSGTTGLVSPKVTAVLGPWGGTEIYLNYGHGFHSNDPRAATTVVDPSSGEPVDSEDPLVPARGAEIGLRTVALPGLQSTVALWYLAFDSELIFVGDAGIAEASRPSRRLGVEWTNYLRLTDWMTGELDLSLSRARFSDFDTAGDFIPGALDRVIAGAITVTPVRRVFGSVRLRHFGPRPLIEDNSVQSEPTTIWNGEIGVRLNERLDVVVEGFNLLDSEVSDIDYFYTSRLPGEPAGGVGRHPLPPVHPAHRAGHAEPEVLNRLALTLLHCPVPVGGSAPGNQAEPSAEDRQDRTYEGRGEKIMQRSGVAIAGLLALGIVLLQPAGGYRARTTAGRRSSTGPTSTTSTPSATPTGSSRTEPCRPTAEAASS